MTTPQNPPEELDKILDDYWHENTSAKKSGTKKAIQHLIDRARIEELEWVKNSFIFPNKLDEKVFILPIDNRLATLPKQQSKEEYVIGIDFAYPDTPEQSKEEIE